MNEKVNPRARQSTGATITKAIRVAVVIVVPVIAAKYFDLQQVFRDAPAWISGLGPLGPLIVVTLYTLACVLLLPGSILKLGAGVVFGVVKGSIAFSIGATLGAT